jgi:hypothetical protein
MKTFRYVKASVTAEVFACPESLWNYKKTQPSTFYPVRPNQRNTLSTADFSPRSLQFGDGVAGKQGTIIGYSDRVCF